jgi:hypothetical protein
VPFGNIKATFSNVLSCFLISDSFMIGSFKN